MREDIFKKYSQEKLLQQKCDLDQVRKQVESYSPELLEEMQRKLKIEETSILGCSPYMGEAFPPQAFEKVGKDTLSQGKVGCIILAAGQGSRLGFMGPKGTFSISPVKKKSLFQILSEKVLFAGKRYHASIPLGVMTCSANYDATKSFFQRNQFFGLDPSQVDFFTQDNLPYCDEEGNWFLDEEGKLVEAATGNGDFWRAFSGSPLMSKYVSLGIEHIFIMSVDNPLVLAFDESMIGFHCDKKVDITASAVIKKDPLEKIGVFAQKEGKMYILEYIFAESQKFPYGNIGDYYVSLSFIRHLNDELRLPLHKVKKHIECVIHGKKQRKEAWKWERFIFDIFPSASVGVFPIDRSKGFAPLKAAEGPHGIAEVQNAICRRDQNQFFSLFGKKLPDNNQYELSQEFYYPTPELIEKWKKKKVESTYLE